MKIRGGWAKTGNRPRYGDRETVLNAGTTIETAGWSSMATEANHNRWSAGDVVVRDEVLNDGRVWLRMPVIVVRPS